jgi:sulfate adenylyltransferase subunit 1
MAVGASFADLAVILVDATQGVLQQTRRHTRICAVMGIPRFVFAVNKMDLAGYSQEHFNDIVQDIITLCEGLDLFGVTIIPVSATEGDNVTKLSENMPWYKGPALLEHLETVDISSPVSEKGFYMPVQRVCRPDHTFRGFQGQVETGIVSVGDTLTALPSEESATVKSIHIGDNETKTAVSGQPATIQFDREVDVSRGCVLTRAVTLKVEKSFAATLLWMDSKALAVGIDYWVKLGTKLLPAVVTSIRHKIDVNSGELLPAASAAKNEIILCEIELSDPIVLDEFKRNKTMGELILIDRITNATAACGVVESTGERNRTLLSDGKRKLAIRLFDSFYYHSDTHTITRHNSPSATYRTGDVLPLQSDKFNYPPNFDIQDDLSFARIRNGKFAGFGEREANYPLLDINGIDIQSAFPREFNKYRNVIVWENDYTI